MKLTPEEVQKIADLARLELRPGEVEKYGEQLSNILSNIESLKKFQTDTIEPTAHAIEVPTPFRNDEVVLSDARELTLANAPEREGDLFKVAKVL
ncbi:MAG: Asp-tRNA(Asn)/Glu-tRNA(Gln) amidotransferase subunit GatC [Deltaproteobacteria bacterium]|nr:Asp-tRNA(Asn)/Glu-tRNA(Gln) amidotransferase subunit GatC [Deltaproteobacteria bacterium]